MVLPELTFIGIALLIGLLSSLLAEKFNLPKVLLLIIVGIIFGSIIRLEKIPIGLPNELIAGISIFTLILIIFESTSKIRFRELDIASISALRLTGVTILLNLLFFTPVVLLILYNGNSNLLLMSLLFAAIMSGTSPDIVLSMLGTCRRKIVEVLKLESVMNTPLTIIIPILIINIIQGFKVNIFSDFIIDFIIGITSGVGAGVVVGLIVFKIMRKTYSEVFSPIAVITAAIVTYILAENIGGNGILAVTTLGLFFGNLYIKQKISLLEFESLFSNLLRILIFIIIGVFFEIPLNLTFFIQIFALFICYSIIRFIAVALFARAHSLKENVFIALCAPKGITVVVITLTIMAMNITGFKELITYILGLILLSMIVGTITARSSKFFLGVEIEEEKPKTTHHHVSHHGKKKK
ncbi:cation:proton antiporter [Candidatus Woesearchaeota archaeon]|nr:cation:proton antiporter [Candidatus Woesearchaeota archaeon]